MFKKIKDRIKELFDKIREKLKQLMKEITERFREKQYVAYLEKLKTMIKKDPGLGNVTVTVTDCDEFEDDGYDGKEVLDMIVLLAQQYAQEFRTINQAMDDLDNVDQTLGGNTISTTAQNIAKSVKQEYRKKI